MSYKLRQVPFNLTDPTINKILAIANSTKGDHIEHAITLCSDDAGNLTPGGECAGTVCSVHLRDCAGTGKKEVASVHTHPGTDSQPSFADLMSGFARALTKGGGEFLDCRVGEVDGRLSCNYIKIPPEKMRDMMHFYLNLVPRFKLARTLWDEWEETGVMPERDFRAKLADQITESLLRLYTETSVPLFGLEMSLGTENVGKPHEELPREKHLHWEVIGRRWVEVEDQY
jgi:hypothetical protein